MTATPTAADELVALAAQVRRLRPDWRDAEGFYELRSEISGALMRISRRLNGHAYLAAPPAPPGLPPPHSIAHTISPSRCETVRPPAAAIIQPPPRRAARSTARRRARPIRHRFPLPPVLPVTDQPRLL
jgi:hypothetical protein